MGPGLPRTWQIACPLSPSFWHRPHFTFHHVCTSSSPLPLPPYHLTSLNSPAPLSCLPFLLCSSNSPYYIFVSFLKSLLQQRLAIYIYIYIEYIFWLYIYVCVYIYIYQIESRKSEMELMQALISSHWIEWVRFTYIHVDTIKLLKTSKDSKWIFVPYHKHLANQKM